MKIHCNKLTRIRIAQQFNIILLVSCMAFFYGSSQAQPKTFVRKITDTFLLSRAKYKWLAVIKVEPFLGSPIYDSTGMIVSRPVSGSFLFLCSSGKLTVQKIDYEDLTFEKFVFEKKLVEIRNGPLASYNRDSLNKLKTEGIFAYIFKDSSQNTYHVLGDGDHETKFEVYIKTDSTSRNFEFSKNAIEDFSIKYGWAIKNLNYDYNRNTSFYRFFCLAYDVISENF